jgi:hypothetical protein
MNGFLICGICRCPIYNPGTDGIPMRAHGTPMTWVHWRCVAEWDRRYLVPPPDEPQDEPAEQH